MGILNSGDSGNTAIAKIANSNAEARKILNQVKKKASIHDPEMISGGMGYFRLLDKFEIYGEDIRTVFEGKCASKLGRFLLLLRATDLKLFKKAELKEISDSTKSVVKGKDTPIAEWMDLNSRVKKYAGLFRLGEEINAGPSDWLFLFFKALWFSPDYVEFCRARRNNDLKLQDSIRAKYPELSDVHYYWGDIFECGMSKRIEKAFELWVDRNKSKFFKTGFDNFCVISEGQKLTAKSRTVYFTVPDAVDTGLAYRVLAKSLNELLDSMEPKYGYSWLKLHRVSWDNYYQIYKTERRIDVYFWRTRLGLSSIDSMRKAYKSGRPAWDYIRVVMSDIMAEKKGKGIPSTLEDIALNDMGDFRTEFRKLNNEGEVLVRNTLHNKFPLASSPK